jgi:hypothetical protein
VSNETFAWLMRLKSIEREYTATRLAIDRLKQHTMGNPDILVENLKFGDIKGAADRLENTFVVRIFSEFESALKHFLRAQGVGIPRSVKGRVNNVKALMRIPKDDTKLVHRVRINRNNIVHDSNTIVESVTMRDSTKFLCTFLGRCQRVW